MFLGTPLEEPFRVVVWVLIGGLVIATGSGGAGGAIAATALVGIGACFLWTYRANPYDSHGCRIEYLYTDRAYPRTYHRSQIGRDIPADVAARHPDHIID